MTRWNKTLLLAMFMALVAASTAMAQQSGAMRESVVGSPHDLSSSGPGRIHALDEEQVCV